jgi:hypothetical protein
VTEEEWNACTDPEPMLEFLRGKASKRKLRLFGIACCRRIWHLMTDERCRSGVDAAERFADGKATADELITAHLTVGEAHASLWNAYNTAHSSPDVSARKLAEDRAHTASAALYLTAPPGEVLEMCLSDESVLGPDGLDSVAVARGVSKQVGLSLGFCPPSMLSGDDEARIREWEPQCRLLRDLLGRLPFRLPRLTPAWLTSTVKNLAEAIYQDKTCDTLPILADALEDAGCTNVEVLEHCRQPGVHTRGCWVVDLVLGKE